MKPPVASYTLIRNWTNCPRKAYNVNLIKSVPFVETDASRWGSRGHKALENKINNGTPLPAELQRFDYLTDFGHPAKSELALGMTATGEPCGFFDNSKVWLRGKIDVQLSPYDGLAIIADWKFGKKREDEFELRIHALLLKATKPEYRVIMGFYVWLQEEHPIGKTFDLSDTQSTFNEIKHTMDQINDAIEMDNFPPRPNPLCGYCDVVTCEHNRKQK